MQRTAGAHIANIQYSALNPVFSVWPYPLLISHSSDPVNYYNNKISYT